MKKIFLGMSNLLLIVITFTYMVITVEYSNEAGRILKDDLVGLTNKTGFPVIGIIFLIPAFIFTIIYLSTKNKYNELFKSLFSLFGGIFCLLTGVIGLTLFKMNYYIPYIVTFASLFICVISIISIVCLIKNDELKKDEPKEEIVENINE